jgi:sec-independent protein translocase protein TatA
MIGDILQPTHILFILVIALIVLGPKKLPEVGRSLGKSMQSFRSAMSGAQDQINEATGGLTGPIRLDDEPAEETERQPITPALTAAAEPVVSKPPPAPVAAAHYSAPSAAAATATMASGSAKTPAYEPDPSEYAD